VPSPAQDSLNIIYQDDKLLAASKPAEVLSVPGKTETDCMEARVQATFPTARICHRLDMSTSGLLLFALDPKTHRNIGLQFEKRKIQKVYIARIWGEPSAKEGFIDLPLRCDWPNRPRQMVDHEEGRSAQTHWRIIAREADDKGNAITRVELKPITGRSHQLRVHMLELGHPILGDNLYAHEQALAASPRLHLHAQALSLHHPDDGRIITLEDPCPF
tara:strand:+ start:25716 stop:26366 length:651 start_codon:yes stop_codon:yes gene_type:complete